MDKQHKYTHVLWDWNGTLFNDVEWCFKVINTMLSKRGLEVLRNIEEYHGVFCFPIIQYYRNVGFDFEKEPFEALAAEYMELYHSNNSGNCKLSPNSESVLTEVRRRGISQIVLSASELQHLKSQMSRFNIFGYFDEILGLSDIYAASKIEIGKDYIKRHNTATAVLIGDSAHDYEVAQAIGVDCFLIPNGHQGRGTLLSCGVPVLNDISDVLFAL